MKFTKLIPNWFTRMPRQVKLSVITLFIGWCVVLAIQPIIVITMTGFLAALISLFRLVNWIILGE